MVATSNAPPLSADAPAGYRLVEKIAAGGATLLYRATRESDQQSVVIKTLRADQATRENIAMLQHEADILSSLTGDNIIGPPAIMFYNRDGEELKKSRVAGYMDGAAFVEHVGKVYGD